jgi:phage FluMu protein Com
MEEVRCKKCRRLLMKAVNFASCGIYIKCPKCHYYQHFGAVSETEEENNLGKEHPRTA